MTDAIELVLFDVGGVLVELGPSPVPDHLLQNSHRQGNLMHSDFALAFERGLTSAEAFATALIDELELDAGVTEILDHFLAWPRGLYAGSAEMLAQVQVNYRAAILTNTNVLHWPRFENEFALPQCVERVFASHQLGLAKPQTEVFTRVAAELELTPEAILFIDDNPANVAAAANLGFATRRACGHAEVKQTLLDYGIIERNQRDFRCT